MQNTQNQHSAHCIRHSVFPQDRRPLRAGGRIPYSKVLVVGLGISGLWTARWLTGQGTDVIVSEMKPESELDPELLRALTELGVKLETGGHRKETFSNADAIILSPGVPHDMALITSASKRNIPVMGEMELASRFIDIPIIAVTGTNGKTTVTSLLGLLIENAGFKAFVGGNIGTPLMAYVAGEQEADYLVLEVSSFQLDTIETFCPFISIILNISPDHLDRYPDYEAYARSKLRIYENQGDGHYLILNADDPRLSLVSPSSDVSLLWYGLEKKAGRHSFLEGKMVIASLDGATRQLFSLDAFALPGAHNRENLLSAVLAGMALGIDAETIQKTINQFKGLPHRLEYVDEFNGVRFYNDSKATNVDAAVRAVTSFDRPLILIAGGRHKGADYAPLVEAGCGRLRGAVFLGEAKGLLSESFCDEIPFALAEKMEDAVFKAFSMAGPGDAVLLAPACSSFDMFSDYSHRGRVFRKAVEGLIHG
ncbi:MAG: UDP-N-acetylmuramoyl-L-alanine--D-glutamate ligase [Proteobacteria bacterium]|nr:UDP-N-acetylmuramoyl-L-alanine--D-glutamate ligase [Desulfobacterales bacterium]MBL7101512.1 UDP-N-acetylmuramoyl-L-alanine--D-glutamate ligase [Desulfobacteraceae bacterium]MBL7172438.1 UDP-N-acetylmuramoyl-L-alanine--D-glutamate ligase [Desulfobacteraceae bacterium]MBU1902308.1 UDP-N-acetylmuramoyl-L-alanine--D-glutamate ligase [Pseudomonadota bacterium]